MAALMLLDQALHELPGEGHQSDAHQHDARRYEEDIADEIEWDHVSTPR